MSYDVHLSIPTGGDSSAEVFWRNMTSNVAPMWRKAGADLAEMDGLAVSDCVDKLAAAIADMKANPEVYREMNPDNGWGSYETCLDFLQSIHDACIEHPACTISVSR